MKAAVLTGDRLDDGHREPVALLLQRESLRPWNILFHRYRVEVFILVYRHNPYNQFAHCRGSCSFPVRCALK